MRDHDKPKIYVRRADLFGWLAKFDWPHIEIIGGLSVETSGYSHWSLSRRRAIKKAERHLARLERIRDRRDSWEPT